VRSAQAPTGFERGVLARKTPDVEAGRVPRSPGGQAGGNTVRPTAPALTGNGSAGIGATKNVTRTVGPRFDTSQLPTNNASR
jgi:hypothetical protein